MKNYGYVIVFISLLLSMQPVIRAQEPDTNESTLYQAIQKQFLRVKKILKCAAGRECSQDEMHQARILLSNIFAGIILLTGITVFLAKKIAPIWQSHKMWQATEKLMQEGSLENLSKDQLLFYAAVTVEDVNGIKQKLEEGIQISPYLVESISIIIKDNKPAARKLYTVVQGLANQLQTDGKGMQKLQFNSEQADQDLWNLFKNSGVIPSNRKGQRQFYRWSIGNMETSPSSAIAPKQKQG